MIYIVFVNKININEIKIRKNNFKKSQNPQQDDSR